jgi:hypothetical protein
MQAMSRLRDIFFTVTVALITLATGAAWWAYGEIGKTPGELMDYAQRRLQGHNKLEWVALPAMGQLRSWLNQPSRDELLKIPFVIPPPPALVKTLPGTNPDTTAPATDPTQRILLVGPFEEIRTIAQAAKLARDGDVVEIQAGEYRGDVAVWMQKKLTIRTRGGNARLFADGKSAEAKAIWVIRDGDFSIENIDFLGTQVSDHNGAGIRFEGGNLHIKNCLFYGNENGLLTTGSAGTLTIENSEFAYNGFGDGQSHNIYVGKIRALKITGSYFHHANVGHLIKSRAQNNHIYYNRITDESGGRASYELDLPNGGVAYIVGNIIQQGAEPQNSTLIAYGAEGLTWPENRLYLASNTIVNDTLYGGTFFRTTTGTQQVVSINNLLIGKGKVYSGQVSVTSINDIRAGWDIFSKASRYDYDLNVNGQMLPFVSPAMPELTPHSQYAAKRKITQLEEQPRYPGAVQYH